MQFVSLKSFENILPLELVQRLCIEHNVDKCNQIRLPGLAVFSCLLETTLWGCDTSQRALADVYEANTGQTADHSSFGKRLAGIPVDLFRDIFEYLYQVLTPTAPPSELQKLRIQFVDATIVTLSARLINFGLLVNQKIKKGPRRDIKTVFSLDGDGLPRLMRLCTNKNEHNDNVALGDPILASMRPNDLFVFDSGLTDRNRFLAINNANAYFLTRHVTQKLNTVHVLFEAEQVQRSEAAPQKGDATYQLLRVEECRFGAGRDIDKFESMPIVAINGRRWDSRKQKWSALELITNLPLKDNNTKAGAYTFTEVAELYRQRWEIETFFKFIKQNLGYGHILSRTQNGIEVMIYMTLITALLMIWYKRITRKAQGGWPSIKRWMANDADQWTANLMNRAIWTQVAARKTIPRRI
jgi:hypothetical protein